MKPPSRRVALLMLAESLLLLIIYKSFFAHSNRDFVVDRGIALAEQSARTSWLGENDVMLRLRSELQANQRLRMSSSVESESHTGARLRGGPLRVSTAAAVHAMSFSPFLTETPGDVWPVGVQADTNVFGVSRQAHSVYAGFGGDDELRSSACPAPSYPPRWFLMNIGIMSYHSERQRKYRMHARRTWMQHGNVYHHVRNPTGSMMVRFVFGSRELIDRSVLQECDIFCDCVFVHATDEGHKGKVWAYFAFAYTHMPPARFYVKTDDDGFVRTQELENLLLYMPDNNVMMGHTHIHNSMTFGHGESKNFPVKKVKNYADPFGKAEIISRDLVRFLAIYVGPGIRYEISELEDVVTGGWFAYFDFRFSRTRLNRHADLLTARSKLVKTAEDLSSIHVGEAYLDTLLRHGFPVTEDNLPTARIDDDSYFPEKRRKLIVLDDPKFFDVITTTYAGLDALNMTELVGFHTQIKYPSMLGDYGRMYESYESLGGCGSHCSVAWMPLHSSYSDKLWYVWSGLAAIAVPPSPPDLLEAVGVESAVLSASSALGISLHLPDEEPWRREWKLLRSKILHRLRKGMLAGWCHWTDYIVQGYRKSNTEVVQQCKQGKRMRGENALAVKQALDDVSFIS